MTFETEYPMVNEDLERRFDIQPIDRDGEPAGQVFQISLPNGNSHRFALLLQAFMRASRVPFPELESYWAGDVVTGVGKGSYSLLVGLGRGVTGLVYEPYVGAQERGILGMSLGIFKGIGGFIIRPLVGGFEFITQPLIGIINTPKCIYNKLT